MAEHLIRLRGGWSWLEPGHSSARVAHGAGRRLTLPLDGPERTGLPRLVRLVRCFGLPPRDALREELALRLDAVEGLKRVQLNGRDLARPAPGTRALELPLEDPLPRRNLLVLDVDLGTPGQGSLPERPAPWGMIALVIRTRAPLPRDHPLGETPPPP